MTFEVKFDLLTLFPKTYNFKHYISKERGIKKCNESKHKSYYNAVFHNTEKTVEECTKISLTTFDDKRF